jgi:cytochrome c
VGLRMVSCFKGVMVVLATTLFIAGAVSADSRSEVLERIKPVGQVTVAGKAAPAATQVAADSATAAPATEAAAAPEAEGAKPADAATAPAAADSSDPAALAQAKGCLACHQIDVKVVGPAYKDVAAKYKGNPDALATLVEKVKTGGSGNWGQIPMPPQVAASDEEIKILVKWVLSQ